MPYYDSPGSTNAMIAELAAQQRRANANNRMESAVVGSGGATMRGGQIVVANDDGTPVTIIGKLADGSSGIQAVGTSGQMTFEQLAFGTKYAKDNSQVSLGKPAYGSAVQYPANQWVRLGPSVSAIEVTSGRIVVNISANLNVSGDGNGQFYVGVALTKPDGSIVSPSTSESLSINRSAGVANELGAGREVIFEGLPPGVYGVSMSYYNSSIGDPGIAASAFSRSISVRLI